MLTVGIHKAHLPREPLYEATTIGTSNAVRKLIDAVDEMFLNNNKIPDGSIIRMMHEIENLEAGKRATVFGYVFWIEEKRRERCAEED